MRPVVRGSNPTNALGTPIIYKDYAWARGELIDRLGEYCSYCGMELDTSLAVEHVRPKQPPWAPTVLLCRSQDWNNFLLACTNCNSTKSNTDVTMSDYVWPHIDNTFRAFTYSVGGVIKTSDAITSAGLSQKIDNTIKLVGLDKMPNDQKASDRRWRNRREAWDIASRAKGRLTRDQSNNDLKEQIVETAQAKGYWSVWYTVFSGNADIRRRLIEAFPGTCADCFDPLNDYTPLPRPGGQC
jgi:hypothetical protein